MIHKQNNLTWNFILVDKTVKCFICSISLSGNWCPIVLWLGRLRIWCRRLRCIWCWRLELNSKWMIGYDVASSTWTKFLGFTDDILTCCWGWNWLTGCGWTLVLLLITTTCGCAGWVCTGGGIATTGAGCSFFSLKAFSKAIAANFNRRNKLHYRTNK